MTVILGRQCRINLSVSYFLSTTEVRKNHNRIETRKIKGLRMRRLLDIRVVSLRNRLLYIDKYTSFTSNCNSLCTWYFVSPFGQTIITTTRRILVSQIGNFVNFKVYLKCDKTFFQYGNDIIYILIPEQKPLVYGGFYQDENELKLIAGTRVFCREITKFPYIKVYREIYVNGKISKSPFYVPSMNTRQNEVVLGCRLTYLLAIQYDEDSKVILKFSQKFPALQRWTVMTYLFRRLFFMVQFMSRTKETISGFDIINKKDLLICRAEVDETAILAITIPLCYGTRAMQRNYKRGPISVSISAIYLRHRCREKKLTAICTLILPKQEFLQPFTFKLIEYIVLTTDSKRYREPIIQITCTTGHIATPDSVIDIHLLDQYKQLLRQLTINVQLFGEMNIINEPYIIPWRTNYLTDEILRVTGTLYKPCNNMSGENNKRQKVSTTREFQLFIPINSLEVSRNGSIKSNEVVVCSGQGIPQPRFHWKPEKLPKTLADDKGRASLAIYYQSNSFHFTKLAESGIYLMTCVGENNLRTQLKMQLEETFMFRLDEGTVLQKYFNLGYEIKVMYLISACVIAFLVLVVHFYWNKEFYNTIFYNIGQKIGKAFYSQVKAFLDDLRKHAKENYIYQTTRTKSESESSTFYGSRFMGNETCADDVNSFSFDYDLQKSHTENDLDELTIQSTESEFDDSPDMSTLLNDSKQDSQEVH